MSWFLDKLKQRKLVQWALACVATSFALLQGIDIDPRFAAMVKKNWFPGMSA